MEIGKSDNEKSIADEIAQIDVGIPHFFLVGAGASRAAFPKGDRNGNKLPVMADFVETLRIDGVLSRAGVKFKGRNFEDVYTEMSSNQGLSEYLPELQDAIFAYFAYLELPDEPTIYDYLLSVLRPKDVIATFNWDPFLLLAARRSQMGANLPRLLFLHGNVMEGFCEVDQVTGVWGTICSRCGQPFKDVPLLYPIGKKDYATNLAIKNAWDHAQHALKHAFMVTIFGYGAPKADVEAVQLLSGAYGLSKLKEYAQIEIIDIRPDEEIHSSWSDFIVSHHFEIHRDFFDSWVMKHPRRSGEAWWNQYMQAFFIEDNPVPRFKSVKEIHSWLRPQIEAEEMQSHH